MVERLNDDERAVTLMTLPEWTPVGEPEGIKRTFSFVNFIEAFGFMAKVAIMAEKADHHPEWSNIYNRVEILLTTHDAGGLSQRDIDMATAIDALVA